MEKTLLLVLLIISLMVSFTFAFELNSGVLYSFDGKLLYALEFNSFSILANAPNTTSGFTMMAISNFVDEHFGMFGGVAKYDVKLDFGTVSLYGVGGMLFPVLDFGFEKITSIVRVGAKYYMNNILVNVGIFSLYKIDNTKLEGIEFLIGYSF